MKKESKIKLSFLTEVNSAITRDGINDLIDYLKQTDFFEAPASTMYHDSGDGGLVLHSLSVFDVCKELNSVFELGIDEESIAICALFHDLCKVDMYVKGFRNKKIDGKWEQVEIWEVKDQLPMGHGEKSVYIINKFMQLSDEEALAIRWHLGGFDTAVHFSYPYGFPSKQAFREYPLVTLLAISDMAASYLLNEKEEK